MQTLSLLLFLFLFNSNSFAQQTYVITYKDFGRSDNVVKAKIANFEYKFDKVDYYLAFNDTVAISFYGLNGNKLSSEKFYIAKKQKSHASYYYRKNESFYFLSGHSKQKQKLLLDTTKKHSWNLIDSSKMILNQLCKLAYGETPKGDTLVAWYSTKFNYPYGFYDFNGLPGVALEIMSQADFRHIIATKVEIVQKEIYFPSNLKIYYYQD